MFFDDLKSSFVKKYTLLYRLQMIINNPTLENVKKKVKNLPEDVDILTTLSDVVLSYLVVDIGLVKKRIKILRHNNDFRLLMFRIKEAKTNIYRFTSKDRIPSSITKLLKFFEYEYKYTIKTIMCTCEEQCGSTIVVASNHIKYINNLKL